MTSAHDIAYTDIFFQLAQDLANDAAEVVLQPDDGHRVAALQLLRACALLRVARFPYSPSTCDRNDASVCSLKKTAYALQKSLYTRAMRLWDDSMAPLEEVLVPHIHDQETQPDPELNGRFDNGPRLSRMARGGEKTNMPRRRPQIPVYVRVPLDTILTGEQCPTVVILSNDRTGDTWRCEDALRRGWAAIVVEVPGTGECPVPSTTTGKNDTDAEARLWSSVLDWMQAMYFYDMDRVVAVGSGDVAVRLANTHGDRLKGVVAHIGQEEAETLYLGDDQEAIVAEESSMKCPSLMVSEAASSIKKPKGMWTPAVEEEEDGEFMRLSEYRPEMTGCVGQMGTSDMETVYGWMEDVMESRETRIYGASLAPEPCGSDEGSKMLWWVDQWKPPSPPHSESEKGWLKRTNDVFS